MRTKAAWWLMIILMIVVSLPLFFKGLETTKRRITDPPLPYVGKSWIAHLDDPFNAPAEVNGLNSKVIKIQFGGTGSFGGREITWKPEGSEAFKVNWAPSFLVEAEREEEFRGAVSPSGRLYLGPIMGHNFQCNPVNEGDR